MKKYNIFKVLTIVILLTIVLSFIVPGTTLSYGQVTKGTVTPIPFADVFTNGITSLSAFLTLFIYVLIIGAFYAVLYNTGKYEKLVNNVAVVFNKNKGVFIVLTIFALGLVTMFTGEIYSMLIFVPFLISVVRKLGYSKETSVITTLGAILLGNAGTYYTYYTNQMLSLTVKDNLLPKTLVGLIGLVILVGFILVFGERPNSTKDLKKETDGKLIPLHIIMWFMFALLVLGFVNWEGYFGFKGFDQFLESAKKVQIFKVSIFDALVGKTVVAFGKWQPFNAATLFTFVSVLIGLIYKEGVNGFLESFAKGLKKAFPYALIVILANLVLVNVYSSGVFNTIAIGLTKKSVTVFSGTITGIVSSIVFPDYAYATQFTLSALLTSSAKNYQNLFAVLYQAIYSLFLLVSPTSILLLLGLRYTETRYVDWIKYIYKFFLVLFVTLVLVVSLSVKGFDASSLVALILLIAVYGIIVYMKLTKEKVSVLDKVEVKEEKKVETKKEVKPVEKKETVKKTTKKTNKKTTKKTNKK